MIRFLQQDSHFTKALFIVIIGLASVSMVVYLIPGLTGAGGVSSNDYAVVYAHWYSRVLASGDKISQQSVEQRVRQQLQRQNPEYANSPIIVNYYQQRVGQQMIQQKILLAEARRLGIRATDADVRTFLHTGQYGEYLFPNGQFIGEDKYTNFIANQFSLPVGEFEEELREEIQINRLRAFQTAGVAVSDAVIRDSYRKQNIKIKFDYAVISGDSLRSQINPSDAELQGFFKSNAMRYASAVPEQRKLTWFAFNVDQIPGGVPAVSDGEIQSYFNAHKADYQTPDQARARHILIKVAAGADAKTDAAAKAKADGLLQQIRAGANFTDLAKKNSDDPGSKDTGGELGFAKHGAMVPEFDHALFSQKIGDTAVIKSQFGYHIVQVEERQSAHALSLNEVQMTIRLTLVRQKVAAVEEKFAQTLVAEAAKNGLEKAASAHHLQIATTEPLGPQGVVAALPDSSAMLGKAFNMKQGDAPQYAATGEGYAIFKVSEIVKAHAPEFSAYKDRILSDYRADRLPKLLAEKTQDLANKAKASNDLAKAAKAVGATVKTSDLVGESGQVPDMGQVSPELFDLAVGAISKPIQSPRNGVVVKVLEKQEPSAAEIAQNLDKAREQLVEQRRGEAFNVFVTSLVDRYKKSKLVQLSAKAEPTQKVPSTR